jgi:cell wall-associated NlpC family hydrolase
MGDDGMKLKTVVCSICALTLLNAGASFAHADEPQKIDTISHVKAEKTTKATKSTKSSKSAKASKSSKETTSIQKVDEVKSIQNSNEIVVSKLAITTNVENQQKALDDLDSELKTTSEELTKLKEAVIGGQSSSDDELAQQKTKVDELQKKLEAKQKELSDQLAQASKQLDERKSKVNEMLRNAQKDNASSNIMSELLQSDSLSDIFRKNIEMKNLTDAQVQYVKDTEQATTDLQTLQKRLDSYSGKLEELKPILEIIDTQIEANAKRSAELAAQAARQRAALSQASTQSVQKQVQTTNVAANKSGNALVDTALSYLGVPYVWGGHSPAGFDCSGFMQYVYRQVTGKNIGGWTVPQESSGTVISVSQAQPGDLLFYGSFGSTHHVGMYIGNGQMVHAPQPGDVVKITSLSWYYPSFAVRPAV